MIHTWRTDETDPFARGRAIGATWAPQVRATLTEYEDLFAVRGVSTAAVMGMADATRDVVSTHAPEVLAEIDGVADGAGIQPWQAVALNARTEILARAAAQIDECSTAVHLPADGKAPRTVQTWDWYAQMAHDTLVRSYPVPGARVVTFGEFGQVAKIGVSSRGLGVHFNILRHSSDGSRVGVPVHVVSRMILDRAHTLADAEEILDSVPLGASTVLTVVTAEPAAASLEVSPAGWAPIRGERGGVLVHTNHFLDAALAAGDATDLVSQTSTTRGRLGFLREHDAAVTEPDPLRRVQALAVEGADSICVDPDLRRAQDDRPETKVTITLDVEGASLGIAASHPKRITAADWQTVTA